MRAKLLIMICLLMTINGCTLYAIDGNETASDVYLPKTSVQDVIYLEKTTKPHQVIGYVTVYVERRQHMEEVIAKMKREAAIIGGDAITEIQEEKPILRPAMLKNAYVRTRYKGKVIAFNK